MSLIMTFVHTENLRSDLQDASGDTTDLAAVGS